LIQPFFYYSLKKYCTAALHFYFRKWQVRQVTPVPSGPVIFVSNHQNAFLDAVLIACSSKSNPWFITRANVFSKLWVKKILTWLQMLPVYRFRDGFSTLRKNDEIIDKCVQLLTQQKSILIFGEGNHNDQWYLRSLQKGFARIALAAEERNHWKLGVKIVPVGIQYESHTDFRSRVLVSFGDPILVKDYHNTELSTQQNLDMLIQRTREGIMPLILHIDPLQYDNTLSYLHAHRKIKTDLVEQLESDQKLVEHAPENYSIVQTSMPIAGQSIWNPIRIYESINNFPARSIVRWFLKNKVKDPQFIGSLKFSIGMIVVPVFYIIQTGICYEILKSWAIALGYFVSLPMSVLLRR